MKFQKHSHIPFLLMAILVTIFVAAVYAYMYQNADSAIKKSREARAELAVEMLNKASAEKYIADYSETSSDWQKIPGYFVTSETVVGFIEDIEKIGDVAGSKVTISTLDSSGLENTEGTQGTIKARVTAEGSWASVMKSLKLIELLPYSVSIKDVKVFQEKVTEKGKEYMVWKLSLGLDSSILNKK